ncbi:MAG TPA: RdgB/HAM1 family non-canonical purine NTP pyrophosphatase [Candidatus Merdibacter merdavium]|uniref:dITP/XTP pyrophosphatase n=1 Tax=Candidatus Merdibacter merdavium TaxID=2838692 RepID=A0A9D2NTQ5_9FIRM|nr:RdgB/HAM1 family non-canonical purine NTP pyrophosphatase [Candidatus Merdibacter merdavium]
MKEIMIATSNAHKVEEFREMLEPLGFQVRSLLDLNEQIEIEETGTTFAENAMIKAETVHARLGIPVISDDSGLEVDAMDKAPGVYSARFLGYDTAYEVKNQFIMDQVKGKTRSARYVCAIAYVEKDGTAHVFTGVVEGEIADHARGDKGFGYDPIFYYPPYTATLAEVSEEQKNAISHRGRALAQLIAYMKEAEQK